jgi:membrane protein YdbS with pleckstrin-like domain
MEICVFTRNHIARRVKMPSYLDVPPEFDAVKDQDEEIYWVGKPAFVPFIALGIPFLIFGLFWGAFDYFGFIRNMGSLPGFLMLFMLFHLFPFYGGILNMVRLVLVHKNTCYAYTNKRMMIRSGFWGIDFKSIDYDKIVNLEVNVNPLEKIFNVGSIRIAAGDMVNPRRGLNQFTSIQEPYEVFKKIKEVSVDIKTDWHYPNKLRPDENPGYASTYSKKKL